MATAWHLVQKTLRLSSLKRSETQAQQDIHSLAPAGAPTQGHAGGQQQEDSGMGIFSRMTDIINSNLSALLDKAEDPEKMIRLIIQEMEDTLVEVRSSSARVIADRKAAARRLAAVRSEVDGWEQKARLALAKGREDLARAALQEKHLLADELAAVEAELSATDEHIEQLNEEIGQLQQKLGDARARQKAMLMRSQTVESRIRVKRQIQREALDDAFRRFEHFERRMDNLEGQLESMDLGREAPADLAAAIDALVEDERITDEIERLRRDLDTRKGQA